MKSHEIKVKPPLGIMPERQLFKVLVSNKSCHGGDFDWTPYLPTGNLPGKWTPTAEDAKICYRGWHLTVEPMKWLKVGMQVYRAEGSVVAGIQDDKHCFMSVRLLAPAKSAVPRWWRDVEAFVSSIDGVPWFQPQREPDPEWKVFDTGAAARAASVDAAWAAGGEAAWAAAAPAARDAAGDAAWAAAASVAAVRDAARAAAGDAARAAAGAAAWDAAWAAARDAVLVARIIVCDGLPLDAEHKNHAKARWAVWRAGYGLACDVSGVLYVYRKP